MAMTLEDINRLYREARGVSVDAILVEIPEAVEHQWYREFMSKAKSGASYANWLTKYRLDKRKPYWDEYQGMSLLWAVCKDETDAVLFKLKCL